MLDGVQKHDFVHGNQGRCAVDVGGTEQGEPSSAKVTSRDQYSPVHEGVHKIEHMSSVVEQVGGNMAGRGFGLVRRSHIGNGPCQPMLVIVVVVGGLLKLPQAPKLATTPRVSHKKNMET